MEFIWDNIKKFAFIKYAIVCFPLDNPKFCFFATTVPLVMVGGRITFALSVAEIYALGPTIRRKLQFPNSYSTYRNACKCTIFIRQPPTLRDLASHSVFHPTFNLSEYQLTGRTLFHPYIHAANSHLVPDKLIPYTGLSLQSANSHPTLWGAKPVSINTA